jgi:hypothetical protein
VLERTLDPARVNAVANHPAVIHSIDLGRNLDYLDASDVVLDERNVCLFEEHGGFVCVQEEGNSFDVHTLFVPEGRGPRVAALARTAARILFCDYGAVRLTTFVPEGNRQAYILAKRVGFNDAYRGELYGQPGTFMLLLKDNVCH